jgi:hypothetical protein
MTKEAAEVNYRARSFTGVVVGRARDAHCVRVRRDGQKTVMLWHENAWEPLSAPQQQEGE